MPRKVMTMRSVSVYPRYRSKETFALDNIRGTDLLTHFESWAGQLPPDHFVDRVKMRYGTKPVLERRNRIVIVSMRTGHLGSPDELVIDSNTHDEQYRTKENDAATVLTRCALLIPPGAKVGMFFTELQGTEGCGSRLLDSYEAEVEEISLGLTQAGEPVSPTFRSATIVETEAWLQAANLSAVNVIRYDYTSDIGDDAPLKGVPMRYEQILRPKKGDKWLPKKLWNLIREKQLGAASYLGVPDDAAVDEIIVTLKVGDQEKQVVVGREKGPQIRILLNDAGEPTLDTEAFIERIDQEAERFYAKHSVSWDSTWTRSPQAVLVP